ncbi:unnamed protein product [Amoebophrya sp. A25]|nr:unnamed protein product [Amoebophrya sp. A25]|eukprot:GSA25T00008280001.1
MPPRGRRGGRAANAAANREAAEGAAAGAAAAAGSGGGAEAPPAAVIPPREGKIFPNSMPIFAKVNNGEEPRSAADIARDLTRHEITNLLPKAIGRKMNIMRINVWEACAWKKSALGQGQASQLEPGIKMQVFRFIGDISADDEVAVSSNVAEKARALAKEHQKKVRAGIVRNIAKAAQKTAEEVGAMRVELTVKEVLLGVSDWTVSYGAKDLDDKTPQTCEWSWLFGYVTGLRDAIIKAGFTIGSPTIKKMKRQPTQTTIINNIPDEVEKKRIEESAWMVNFSFSD